MKYENKNIKIVSSKIVESIFSNIYEILNVEKANLRPDISYTLNVDKNNLVEMITTFKLIDKMVGSPKEENVLLISSLTKVNVNPEKIQKISTTEIKVDDSILKQIVSFAMNSLTIKASSILDMYGFGQVTIPFLADASELNLK